MPSIVTLPIPSSWYAVAFSDELRPGAVVRRRVAEREVVLFRTRSGVATAMDAYCPHLGAHLGYGGRVEGECLRCPFHGFVFDTSGTCVATGYGTKPPPTARARTWPLREVNGAIFVYYHPQEIAPDWEPPSLASEGWAKLIYATSELRDHPQETVENSVDLGHFAIVHGYSDVRLTDDMTAAGPHFHIAYSALRPMPVLGRLGARVRFQFDIDIHGLGLSIVTIRVERFGVTARLFVLATPTVKDRINLSLALSLRGTSELRRRIPAARVVPPALLGRLVAGAILQSVVHDARQDFVIWENKRYIQPPALAQGDGPIGAFRIWARQFYPQPATSAREHAPAEVSAQTPAASLAGD